MNEADQRWVNLGTLAREVLKEEADRQASPLPPPEFIRRVHQRRPEETRKARWLGAVGAAVSLAAGACWFSFADRDLSFSAVGGTLDDGTFSTKASRGVLHFTDGSRVTLQAEAQVEVVDTSPQGATLQLREGTAEFDIRHQAETSWSVRSGPFDVQVTGTRFDTSWSERAQSFELRLHEGSVVLSGGELASPQRLKPGERFFALVGEKKYGVLPLLEPALPKAPDAQVGPAVVPLMDPEPPEATKRPTVSETQPVSPNGADWSRLLRDGKFAEVLTQAEARGLQQCLRSCSLAELRALADAARYSSKLEIARRCLHAQRDRFAGDAAATTALYLLGRVEEQAGQTGLAREWYSRYLKESPTGSLAPEAESRLKHLAGTP